MKRIHFIKFFFIFIDIFNDIWFSFLFVVFISWSANFISVWPNICSNNFSSISFDMSASSILKYLDFNSLSPKSLQGQNPFKSSSFFNNFICSLNDFDLSIISSKIAFFSFYYFVFFVLTHCFTIIFQIIFIFIFWWH